MAQLITSSYEHKLACAFHRIDNRGIKVDPVKLKELRVFINTRITELCNTCTNITGSKVYLGKENKGDSPNSINLNSPTKLLPWLKNLGFELPKIRRKNKNTHEFEFAESTNDLVLQKTLANPALWPQTYTWLPQELIKYILEIRELNTIRNRYVNARLYNNRYFCNYNVASTVTGRRGSKKHIFNLGGNAQNFPKHSELGTKYRTALVCDEGNILLFVDQISAEDWPVQALAQNYHAIEEMNNGVNRHIKFASIIFGCSEDSITDGRNRKDPAIELQYYLGKKSRHANNYGMRAQTMSESLAREGYSVAKDVCSTMLEKVNGADPNIDGVFHKYIQEQVFTTKQLQTPFGRERQFFGFRPNDKNYELLNEAYSWIPQSVVGDNTGLAILELDSFRPYVTQDGHDSVCQELPDREEELREVANATVKAFKRRIVFHNGIDIEIPIEGELGFNFNDTVKVAKPFNEENVMIAYKKLKEKQQDAKSADEAVAR